MLSDANVGPYVGVTADKIVSYPNERKLRFILYGAYNAYGLIGPESNGIAVLDEDYQLVVCDEIAKATTGYFGPTQEQLKEFERVVNLNWEDLKALLGKNPRTRDELIE